MSSKAETDQLAAALRLNIGLIVRRLRQIKVKGELTMPESSALARLERGGPMTAADLAKLEQISPQSIGATLAGLQRRGMIARSSDPEDGRRILMSVTKAGLQALGDRRNETVAHLAAALRDGFTETEIQQLVGLVALLERLGQQI
jgi:DNA-binding MarR family transcriptional regulator